jgi:hypothetical protein
VAEYWHESRTSAIEAAQRAVGGGGLLRCAKVLQRAKRRDTRNARTDNKAEPIDVVAALGHQTEARLGLFAPIAAHVRVRKVCMAHWLEMLH